MFQKVKGFRDIFGDDIPYWQRVEESVISVFKSFRFTEFKLPILEKSSVFNRGIGDTTDIVEKEMFSFKDRDDEMLSLRPEGTASLIRAYIENKLYAVPSVKKYFYMGAMFRRERPQKGRFRQFTQAGIEVLESAAPMLDAEVITILYQVAKKLRLENSVDMEINSIGCKSCRPDYNKILREFFEDKKSELCEDCKRRLEKNPLRILDCKVEKCRELSKDVPLPIDHLCNECSDHFSEVKKYLELMGTPYRINKKMVRGLDYYIRTSFELVTTKLGAASAVGAGGRYDGLVELMGGNKDTAGIGFAIGLDRLVELLKEAGNETLPQPDAFIIFFNDDSLNVGLNLVQKFRENGLYVEYDYDLSPMKKQFQKADRAKAKKVVILGQDEIKNSSASIKDLSTGKQQVVPIDNILNILKSREQLFKGN